MAALASPATLLTRGPVSGFGSLRDRRGFFGVELVDPLEVSKRPGGNGSQEILRIAAPTTIADLYEFEEQLYKSGQSRVCRAKCRTTGKDVIVKIMKQKFAPGGEHVWRALLQRMLNLESHSHVLGLHCVYQDDDRSRYYLVMERCNGGDLFDFLQEETDVPEKECKRIMREILEAVDHIHSQGLIHRDIKPENIMFHDSTNDPSTPPTSRSPKGIKLIDFDTCQQYSKECGSPKAKHIVGTMGYIAPEALKGDYSPASDLWSVGVVLYTLMTGDMPFGPEVVDHTPSDLRCGRSQMQDLYELLKDTQIDWECQPWPAFPQAMDLCQKLLAFEPGARSPSARAALEHPWLAM